MYWHTSVRCPEQLKACTTVERSSLSPLAFRHRAEFKSEKLHRRLFGAAIPPVTFGKGTPTAAKLEARVEARERRKPKPPKPTCVWVDLEEVASETYFTEVVNAMMWGLDDAMTPIKKKAAREEVRREKAAAEAEGPPSRMDSRMVSAGVRHVE